MTKNPIYYLDSCIFINYIKQKKEYAEEVEKSIDEIFNLFDNGGCTLLTSSITKLEVFPDEENLESENTFNHFLKRKGMEVLEVNLKIINIARMLRRKTSAAKGLHTLRTVDAIHIASALNYNASKLFTVDGYKEDGNHIKMLSCNKIIDNINIEPPSVNQFVDNSKIQKPIIF